MQVQLSSYAADLGCPGALCLLCDVTQVAPRDLPGACQICQLSQVSVAEVARKLLQDLLPAGMAASTAQPQLESIILSVPQICCLQLLPIPTNSNCMHSDREAA